ncbi:hypothetical protein AB4Z09_04970 [Rhodococcus sp. TAF43]|uniref:hypothetical protein n=1 Tax=unclassified Rhodococcus (in: high G+C Gram-positive bacteria) TaxID=192944 RepID=UPI00158427CA|nr:hypothetical protein [Rhodococcus sp. W8901]QKT13437.1 hypothetical protein HUN07_24280 [Rhodococcus sp. W8901]
MTPVARTTHLDLETGTGITTGEVWDSAGQETHYGPAATLTVTSEVVRAGRRLALIETRLTTPDGSLLVSARASAQVG